MIDFHLPLLAGGATVLAIGVPVLVHLLFRQKPRVMEWAAIRFLPAAKLNQRRRVDHWPLLLLRLLALLLPLLAMLAVMPWAESLWQAVKPGVLESTAKGPRTHTVIVIDSSLSMTVATDGETRLESARRLAIETVAAAQPGDGFSVIVMGSTVDVPVPGPSTRLDVVQAEIERLAVTHSSADFAAGLAVVRDVLGKTTAGYSRRRVLVFGDLQRSAFANLIPRGEAKAPEIWTKIADRAELAFVDVGGGATDNLAVTNLRLAEPLAFVDAPAVVTATIRNFGTADRQNVRVELDVARPAGTTTGPLIAVEGKKLAAIPSGGQAVVSFVIDGPSRFRSVGTHLLKVRLLDADALAADDSRTLAVEVRDSVNVLIVNGKPAGRALRGASDFLAEALAPGGRVASGHPIRVRTIRAEEFSDATLSDFTNVDCVVLCDLGTITPSQAARLETVTKRGGGVVIGLGPNAANAKDIYNRVLGPAGTGLLPGTLAATRTSIEGKEFRLTASDPAWSVAPLAAFQDDNARAGLTAVPFKSYVQLELNPDVPMPTLTFTSTDETYKPEPAITVASRHRGRVAVFTSSFNRDWTEWPVLPSYLPFVHELVKLVTTKSRSFNYELGEAIDVTVPNALAGQTLTLKDADGKSVAATVTATESEAMVRFPPVWISGAGQLQMPGGPTMPLVFAIPEAAEIESNLQRVDAAELTAIHSAIKVVTQPDQLPAAGDETGPMSLAPRPQGPRLARWLTAFSLAAVFFELILAWRLGPARRAVHSVESVPRLTRPQRCFRWLLALLLFTVVVLLAVVIQSRVTGQALAFLPEDTRRTLEATLEVPASEPGEGVRWRLVDTPAFVTKPAGDAVVRYGLFAVLTAGAILLYRRERAAGGGTARLGLPLGLRLAAYAVLFVFVVPQLQLAFEREGDPDVVILIDTSESMATVDRFHDEAKRLAAADLVPAGNANRLQIAQSILLRNDGELLRRIQSEKRCQVHVFSLADRTSPVATGHRNQNGTAIHDGIVPLKADGVSTRLGDGVRAVLKAHRGGSLAGIILLTDGVTTAGESLTAAGAAAAKAGVPLFCIGIGETRETFDLALGDLRADETVAKNDELILEATVRFDGKTLPGPVTVTLIEKGTDSRKVLGSQVVTPPGNGQPVPVKFQHRPAETGEKTFVIETAALLDESETANNRLEKTVLVTDGRKLRVLYLEGRPRYEFRFLKVLFERETEGQRGERAIDFKFLLTDAGKDFATTDRSALAAFPTRSELFEFDTIIFGDLDPATLPKPAVNLQDLAEFVRVKGGGLLLIAGEQAMPSKYFATPLAELLPVLPPPAESLPVPETAPITESYRLKLTAMGRNHPLVRLAAVDAENDRLWQQLQPLYWSLPAMPPRQAAEVLAVHPLKPGADGSDLQPLILQQFQGKGRVMLFAFDETWRWRYRQDEELFNRFWRQAVRVLARNRTGRVELRTDRSLPYRRDEPITLTARFPDDAPPPTGEIVVEIERVSKNGTDRETSRVTLAKVDGGRASYQTILTRTPEGEYRFRLNSPDGGPRKATSEARVIPPPGERDVVQLNAAELERAAAESRGHYYTPDRLASLVDDLPEVERPPLNQPCPPVPLWNHPLIFATLLSLLGCEWVLRKQSRLL